MIEIVYWPNGSWCFKDELEFYGSCKSDDFTVAKVPEFWDDGLVDDWVSEKVNEYN